MKNIFQDRSHAGQLLADALGEYANREDVIVLGLPRGGVPVAFEVAMRLNAPLDVFCVRKVGVPDYPELAMGAVASGGIRVQNEEVLTQLSIPTEVFAAAAAKQETELARREAVYRGHNAPSSLQGKTVIVVDDGIATGTTVRAAIRALRMQKPSRVVIAAPTAAASTCGALGREADDVIVLHAPERFRAVGEWYEDFSQTTDQQVTHLLASARRGGRVPAAA